MLLYSTVFDVYFAFATGILGLFRFGLFISGSVLSVGASCRSRAVGAPPSDVYIPTHTYTLKCKGRLGRSRGTSSIVKGTGACCAKCVG